MPFSLIFALPKKKGVYPIFLRINDSVAQLVEQYTFNVWVLGSNPSGITKNKKAFSAREGFFILRLPHVNIRQRGFNFEIPN